MAKVGLQRASVVPSVGQGIAASVPEHVSVDLDPQLRRTPSTLDHPRDPGADSGAPRSDVNTNGDRALSR
jgi:hypothetical protein